MKYQNPDELLRRIAERNPGQPEYLQAGGGGGKAGRRRGQVLLLLP